MKLGISVFLFFIFQYALYGQEDYNLKLDTARGMKEYEMAKVSLDKVVESYDGEYKNEFKEELKDVKKKIKHDFKNFYFKHYFQLFKTYVDVCGKTGRRGVALSSSTCDGLVGFSLNVPIMSSFVHSREIVKITRE